MKGTRDIFLSRTALLPGIILLFFTSCEDLLTNDTGDQRGNLVDTWKCDEQNGYYKSVKEIYYVEISKHPTDSARILIYNFYNVDANAEAILQGKTLTLQQQTLQGGYQVSGTGEVQGNWNEILWSYKVDDGSGVSNNVNAVYTRYGL